MTPEARRRDLRNAGRVLLVFGPALIVVLALFAFGLLGIYPLVLTMGE